MRTTFREPEVEEAVHNIILQNRCGIRLTILVHEDQTELEFIYKPNAFRRREYRARNFSNRDNFTTLFDSSRLPELRAAFIKSFDYDPFITRLQTHAPSQATNALSIVNIADENCFAISARCPLVLALKPKSAFVVADGLLVEAFADRGEDIVSFISFPGFEESRYRVLDDGTHILQVVENDVVLIGAEENNYQVHRAIKALRGLSLGQLVARNERLLLTTLNVSRISSSDADIQRVLDLNKRFVYSGIDDGGACFGAMNRIYHLIWTRDGSMAAAQYAAAGFPQIIRLWAPFLLANPAKIQEQGKTITAWQQLFGTRWTKAEEDGLFYATWTLFNHFQCTGDDALLRSPAFELLLEGLDDAIATGFDTALGLFASDTRGESTLASSPYYGYDIVNGKMDTHRVGTTASARVISRCVSCYSNIARYNVLRMVDVLLQQRPDLRARFPRNYALFARDLGNRTDAFFLDADGHYRSEWLAYSDGSSGYPDWTGIDYWEYAWALSLMPFHPNIAAAVASARSYVEIWPKYRNYGFTPWNTLTALLFEYGLPSEQARQMLDTEIREALTLTKKYPMTGLFTEYVGDVESWRGLPFGASSFTVAVTGMLLKALPQGIAVRAGSLVDRIDDFAWMIFRINASATGTGPSVGSVAVNGEPLVGTLQIPHSRLRPGANTVEVKRTSSTSAARLYISTMMLLDAQQKDGTTTLRFAGCSLGEVVLQNVRRPHFHDLSGREVPAEASPIPETSLVVYSLAAPEGLELRLGA